MANNKAYAIYGDGFFGGYAGYFSGNVTVTGTFSNPSDEKLKQNMRALESNGSILSKVMKLKPLYYEFNAISKKLMNLPDKTQFGFTAQNIETEFPELVSNNYHPAPDNPTDEFEKKGIDYKSINYLQLIPILTQAIQEQQIIIENLQKQVEEILKKQ